MTLLASSENAILRHDRRQRAVHLLALTYVHLWILEGAFRKWIPQLDSAFYFARDGILILGIAVVFVLYGPPTYRRWVSYILWALVSVWAILLAIQVTQLDVPILVGVAGVRNYIAPILLPILVARDGFGSLVPRLFRTIALYGPVQAALTLVQVSSPRTAWINIQTGGDEAFFTTAGGIVRASGTFSAPAGLILFATLCLIAGLVITSGKSEVSPWLGWLAIVSAIVLIAIGGSRGAVFAAAFVLVAWFCHTAIVMRPRQVLVMVAVFAVGTAAGWAVINAVPAVFDAFVMRFVNASQDENTVQRLGRAVFGFNDQPIPFLGGGAGIYSSIGIALGSGKSWIEVDSTRWVAELGFVGFALAWLRVLLAAALAASIVLGSRRSPLSSSLSAAGLIQVLLFGSITTQPSTQGYFGILLVIFLSTKMRERTHSRGEQEVAQSPLVSSP